MMADEPNDLEVELEEEKLPEVEVDLETEKVEEPQPAKEEPVAAPEVVTPEEGIDEIKKQLAAERAERVAIQERAAREAQENNQLRTTIQDNDLHTVTTAIESRKRDMTILKSNLKAAFSAGDADALADAQEAIGRVSAELLQLESGKAALENRPKPTVSADPVDQLATSMQAQFPNSAQWIRQHPEFVRDPAKYKRMTAAHELVVADGVKVDSPEYLREVEKLLKIVPVEVEEAPAAAAVRRKAAPAAAPVSRGDGGGESPTRMRLSAAEREAAEMAGLTDLEYARHKAALIKDGRYGRQN
jgi:hypothetical protein